MLAGLRPPTLRREPSALQCSLERANIPGMLPLALGMPAPELFPCDELRESAAAILRDGRPALQYGFPERRLKVHIAEIMGWRGVRCTEDEVVLTSGAQQGLTLLAQLLLPRPRAVLVDDAVYPGFRQAISVYSPRLLAVPVSSNGTAEIERAHWGWRKGEQPAFYYAISAGHNPLGTTMTAAQEAEVVDFAHRHGMFIVEDDVYGLLQYDQAPRLPLAALDRESVFYVGSFSKILAPSLRVGWIIAPVEFGPTLAVLKEASDINTATLSQRIVCHYLDTYSLQSRIQRLKQHYRERRDAMHNALLRHLPARTQWHKPSAGFYFWIEDEWLGDTTELLAAALAGGVSFVPGRAFAAGSRSYDHSVRLSFSNCPLASIDEAVRKIAAASQNREKLSPGGCRAASAH